MSAETETTSLTAAVSVSPFSGNSESKLQRGNTTREWTFRHVSPAEAGDFIQITFSDDPGTIDKYVLLSTQFEFPQDYDIQVEVDAGEWYAQMIVTDATLSRTTLTIDGLAGDVSQKLVIHFVADEDDFGELVRVVKLMLPSVVMLR